MLFLLCVCYDYFHGFNNLVNLRVFDIILLDNFAIKIVIVENITVLQSTNMSNN